MTVDDGMDDSQTVFGLGSIFVLCSADLLGQYGLHRTEISNRVQRPSDYHPFPSSTVISRCFPLSIIYRYFPSSKEDNVAAIMMAMQGLTVDFTSPHTCFKRLRAISS